ncbi:MAG TPA: fused MFS/spermidine synthase [Polyangiaceae bacterium]
MRRPSGSIVLFALAFTLSGAAGLLAEQVFEKLLSTLVGASTPAGAVVLATYFAGLTAGALAYPWARRRLRLSPFVVYPALELVVAGACLVLAWRFDALVPAFAPLLRLGVGIPWLLLLLRGLVAAIWIFPLTLPMGATFPAIIDAVDRTAVAGGLGRARTLNALYGANLVGAVLAAVGGPIVVFPVVGMTGALLVAAGCDVVAALLALILGRRVGPQASPAPEAETAPPKPVRMPVPLLALAATTGFLLFALEVTWTHLACAVIGNSVYAFASMLASVLIGLGLGGALSAAVFARDARVPAWGPGAALLAGALTLAAMHPLWPRAPHAVSWLGAGAPSFAAAELSRFAVAAGLLVPPATVLGVAYPLLFRVPAFPDHERGGAAGQLTAVNAVGCILGSLLTGFVVLPHAGSEGTERTLLALTVIAGALAVAVSSHGRARTRGALSGAALLALVALLPHWDVKKLTSGEHVYFRTQSDLQETKLVFVHEDTLGGVTTVAEEAGDGGNALHTLYTNGKFQGNDGSEMTAQTAFAFVPMQYERRFDRALIIGLGTGRTAGAVAHMGFGAMDVAEIAPGIVAAARTHFGAVNDRVLDAPNVSLFLEDGRNLLLLHPTTYDLVTIELTSVWFAGVTSLYSREFYALVRDRLRPGGVLQQWIQLHHIGVPELESVLTTVHDSFPYVSLFVLGGQGIIVATLSPPAVQPAFEEHLRQAGVPALLGLPDAAATRRLLAGSLLLSPADVDRLAERHEARPNTDANRFLEYATPRYNFRSDDLYGANVRALTALKAP